MQEDKIQSKLPNHAVNLTLICPRLHLLFFKQDLYVKLFYQQVALEILHEASRF